MILRVTKLTLFAKASNFHRYPVTAVLRESLLTRSPVPGEAEMEFSIAEIVSYQGKYVAALWGGALVTSGKSGHPNAGHQRWYGLVHGCDVSYAPGAPLMCHGRVFRLDKMERSSGEPTKYTLNSQNLMIGYHSCTVSKCLLNCCLKKISTHLN